MGILRATSNKCVSCSILNANCTDFGVQFDLELYASCDWKSNQLWCNSVMFLCYSCWNNLPVK